MYIRNFDFKTDFHKSCDLFLQNIQFQDLTFWQDAELLPKSKSVSYSVNRKRRNPCNYQCYKGFFFLIVPGTGLEPAHPYGY